MYIRVGDQHPPGTYFRILLHESAQSAVVLSGLWWGSGYGFMAIYLRRLWLSVMLSNTSGILSTFLRINDDICLTYRGTGARSAMGHILSVGFSRKLSSIGTSLVHKICLSLLGMVWYHQKIYMPMTRLVKIWKVCFCYGNSNFLKQAKYYCVIV